MNLYMRSSIFVVSLLLLALFMYINYLIGKKRGLKKSLYQITYRCICVIVAFIISPYLNDYILNYDLYETGRAIRYNGLHFYRIIDFIEEVIVHNEVLNDIYNLFPSLKNLLMDFPQVIFIPFTYVISFILISLFLFPFYCFFAHQKNKRILYEKPHSNKDKIWAGVISSVQSVFLVSIILTPLNGLSRIYKESSEELISEETNICNQNEYLIKYEFACKIIEGYNSSVFGLLGQIPSNKYIYDSLTRINYDNKDTSLNKEVVSIAKAGIILNKTGLLTAISVEDFEDVSKLNFKGLTDEDIDIIVQAFEESLYTKDVLYDVYEWSKQYFEWLMQDLIEGDFKVEYGYEDIISELRIILRTANYVLNNEKFLTSIKNVYKVIDDYITNPVYYPNIYSDVKMFFDVVYNLDIDSTMTVYNYLKDSRIYNDVVPRILEKLLKVQNIEFKYKDMKEFERVVQYILGICKIIQGHSYIYDILHLINDLTIEEVHYLAEFMNYLNENKKLAYLLKELIDWALVQVQMKIIIPTELIYQINDWDREFELVQLVIQVVYKYIITGEIDYGMSWYGLTHYNDTILFEKAFKYLIDMLPDIFVAWLAGKDYKYLVGEYVE